MATMRMAARSVGSIRGRLNPGIPNKRGFSSAAHDDACNKSSNSFFSSQISQMHIFFPLLDIEFLHFCFCIFESRVVFNFYCIHVYI